MPATTGGAASRWALRLAVAAGAWGAVLCVTGGFTVENPLRVSSTDPVRPFVVSGAALVLFALLVGRGPRPPSVRRLDRLVAAVSMVVPWAAILAAGFSAVVFGTFVAGGADSSGYVSQAALWLRGDLRVPVPSAELVPWKERAEWVFAPLGYRPALETGFIVPTYPPGLPLAMAGMRAIFGPEAVFHVVPLFGAAVIGLTFRLGRLVTDRPTAAAASVLLLASPIFLFQVIQPMSDVPVTAWWLAATYLAWSVRSRLGWLGVGACVASALAMRPNLAPLALLFVTAPWFRDRSVRRAIEDGVACAAGIAPAVVFVGGLNASLYGSPLQSGYGSLAGIYAVDNVGPNLRLYGEWLMETGGWWMLAAGLPLWTRLDRGQLPEPPHTVLLAHQHSGSLAHAGRHLVARYDQVGERLDAFVRHLVARGHPVVLIVDEAEVEEIRRAYRASALARLEGPSIRVAAGVVAFDLTRQAGP